MYAMLTGHPPFTGNNANEILHKQQFSQVEKPRHYAPETPQLFEQLVCQLLEKKPEQRVPDALVLSRKIEQIQSRVDFAARQQKEEQQELEAPLPAAMGVEYTEAAGDDKVVHRPGPATLVRDVLRQEAASQVEKSPVARFFDNTFVLVSMLVLVVGLGYTLSQNATPTAAERFDSAEATMGSNASPAWLNARETMRELLKADALPELADDMERMIHRANQYDFCRSLERTTPIEGSRDEEIQRLIRQAFDRFTHGNVVQARAELQSLAIMVANRDRDTYLSEFIETTLTQWAGDTSIRGRHALLASVLKEAQEDRSDSRACMELLESALTLYGDDPMVTEEIGECRELLADIRRQSAQEAAGE
jgi:serine/threonine-protein kinase